MVNINISGKEKGRKIIRERERERERERRINML